MNTPKDTLDMSSDLMELVEAEKEYILFCIDEEEKLNEELIDE